MNIVITGVSRGIGLETTRHLIQQGHSVLGISRNVVSLKDIVSPSSNAKAEFLQFDLEKDKMSDLIARIRKIFPRVHALINNAGHLISKPFEQINSEELHQIFEVNFFSVYNLIQGMVPLMENVITATTQESTPQVLGERMGERLAAKQYNAEAKGAHIVNISSMGGISGTAKFAGLSAYSSSKGALSILTECLAVELSKKNISVNGIAPGAVQTEMLSLAFPGLKAPVSAAQMGEFIADFTVNGHKYFNGKVLPVSLNTP